MNNDNSVTPKVGLGCGTLIIIALIVLVFSNAGNEEEEFKELSQKLDSIESSLKSLEKDVSQMKKRLEAIE
ncbi:MAG: hypothetical protein ACSHYB_16430 [Roseibacillus sp.]